MKIRATDEQIKRAVVVFNEAPVSVTSHGDAVYQAMQAALDIVLGGLKQSVEWTRADAEALVQAFEDSDYDVKPRDVSAMLNALNETFALGKMIPVVASAESTSDKQLEIAKSWPQSAAFKERYEKFEAATIPRSSTVAAEQVKRDLRQQSPIVLGDLLFVLERLADGYKEKFKVVEAEKRFTYRTKYELVSDLRTMLSNYYDR